MSPSFALPLRPERNRRFSRRDFLAQMLGVGILAGARPLFALDPPPSQAGAFRFAFVTDLHLMQGGASRSAEGIAACLATVEKLQPRPDFIICGGDLVDKTRDLSLPEAESTFDSFLKLWKNNTGLPTHWTFGNHDLAATSNPKAQAGDADYAKGLFQSRLGLPHLFSSFDCKGWHFVILDDIALQTDHSYIGQLFDDEIAFLQADLDAHRGMPTIVVSHIPMASAMVVPFILSHDPKANTKSLVCTNADALLTDIPGHNIKAILSGHLHFYENFTQNGVQIVNSGAVCANYWKGPNHGCFEGFGVVDLGADGSVKFDYRSYGWKA